MSAHVRRAIDVLCAYYSDREGQPRQLNAVQAVVYSDGLAKFPEAALEAATRQWMRQSKFFPALSELLALLEPKLDSAASAHLAWAAVETAIRRGGLYRGAHFPQGAIGEAVRQVFGTWATACSFELDSPGWAIRRQSFLAIFPAIAGRPCAPVTLRGLHEYGQPYQVALIAGLPVMDALESGEPDQTAKVLREVERRRLALVDKKAAAGDR